MAATPLRTLDRSTLPNLDYRLVQAQDHHSPRERLITLSLEAVAQAIMSLEVAEHAVRHPGAVPYDDLRRCRDRLMSTQGEILQISFA